MAEDGDLVGLALRGASVAALSEEGQLAVRSSENLDELLFLRSRLRIVAAGRGRWLLWTWLLVLAGATVSVSDGYEILALVVLGVLMLLLVLIIGYIVRVRRRADRAEDWLSELDYRLAQLAARTAA